MTVFQTQILLKHINQVTLKPLPARISDHSKRPLKETLIQILLQTKTSKILFFKLENSADITKFLDTLNSALRDYNPPTSPTSEHHTSLELKTLVPYFFENSNEMDKALYNAV